ncbi:DNA end-binding protein Ku [Tumebacillus sp. BK434]|uniref:non-homologous end joining protein Ku n=1 Tax=Tumebacillus sp. BK434 TaxID=2512169 RepID=UPI00104CE238|nr:Ku protein [Tumebacillus sp. BK434]TCP59280.1 DNA end-binding protein Ku [Tumebacillus sp. BK434]
MHTMWKGSISFGLVNVPVKMFAATEDKDVKFRYLHSECNTPVKNIRTCPTCDREIEWGEVVKGYEYQSGQFIVFSDEEFEKIAPQNTKTIDIQSFVDLQDIDPIYFNKSYYLAPQDTGNKAYALLRRAIAETGKIAIAKMIIRSSQQLAVLRTFGDVIVMETIFYPEEVRAASQIPSVPTDVELDEREVNMAKQLIGSLVTEFVPEQYTNEYRAAILDVIQKKVEGEEITLAAEPKRDEIHDLMKALQASLNVTRGDEAERPVAVGETRAGDGLTLVDGGGDAAPESKPKRRRRKTAE